MSQCPDCALTFSNYLGACAGNFVALNYAVIMAYADAINVTSDCFDFMNLAARPFAAVYCSAAFDHVSQYMQSAASAGVTCDGSTPANCVMSPQPSCVQSSASSCMPSCQADLDLLAAACHAEDVVVWDGDGLPGYLNPSGAPTGTNISSSAAFALFANGTAAVPVNLLNGVSSGNLPAPLTLTACTNATGLYPYYSPPPPNPPSPPPPSPPAPPPPPPPNPPP